MKASKAQERRTARRFDGRIMPGSGNTPFRKGDVQNIKKSIGDRLWIVECKTTSKLSIRIEKKWLDKVLSEVMGLGRDPVLEFQFEATASESKRRYYIVPEYLFEELIG